MLTTQFFALKIRRYMHEHGISEDALVRGRSAPMPTRLEPGGWRVAACSYARSHTRRR